MRFLIDSMLPPSVAALLEAGGADATTPSGFGAHNLPDESLIELATAERRVIVTENASDFARVTSCPVLLAEVVVAVPVTSAASRIGGGSMGPRQPRSRTVGSPDAGGAALGEP